jgi:hypothetical protein
VLGVSLGFSSIRDNFLQLSAERVKFLTVELAQGRGLGWAVDPKQRQVLLGALFEGRSRARVMGVEGACVGSSSRYGGELLGVLLVMAVWRAPLHVLS